MTFGVKRTLRSKKIPYFHNAIDWVGSLRLEWALAGDKSKMTHHPKLFLHRMSDSFLFWPQSIVKKI